MRRAQILERFDHFGAPVGAAPFAAGFDEPRHELGASLDGWGAFALWVFPGSSRDVLQLFEAHPRRSRGRMQQKAVYLFCHVLLLASAPFFSTVCEYASRESQHISKHSSSPGDPQPFSGILYSGGPIFRARLEGQSNLNMEHHYSVASFPTSWLAATQASDSALRMLSMA